MFMAFQEEPMAPAWTKGPGILERNKATGFFPSGYNHNSPVPNGPVFRIYKKLTFSTAVFTI